MARKPDIAGWTLIELVIVIGIVGVLTAMAFPVMYKMLQSEYRVQQAAKQVEADLKTAENISIREGGGDMASGVLVRRSVFVVFNSATSSYNTFTYEDTNGNGIRDPGETTTVGGPGILPGSVTFGTAPGVSANACWGGAATPLKGGTTFGLNGGPPGSPNVPPGCGESSPCLEINSYGFPVADSQNSTQVGGTVYLTDNTDTFAVNMNVAGLITVCKWSLGKGALGGWDIVR